MKFGVRDDLKLLALLVAVASASVAAAPDNRTIVIDEAHNEIVQREGTPTRLYVITAADTLTLDARKFDFHKAGYPNMKPDSIHLIVRDAQYFADWSKSGITQLSADTLVPVNNAPRLAGFRSGDSFAIEIGKKEVDHVKRNISFKVQWAAQVKMK